MRAVPDFNKIMIETWNLVSNILDTESESETSDINAFKARAYNIIEFYVKNKRFQ